MRSPTVDPVVEDCSGIPATKPDPIIQRLEDQISWYNRNSIKAQRAFRAFKITEIIAAALIPFVSGLGGGKTIWIAGGLGVVVTVIEGVINLNQYQQNWITYRSTCEALKHEKYLHLGKAGSYASAADPHSLLAERVESLVRQESMPNGPLSGWKRQKARMGNRLSTG
jgi:hypothetical protein